MSRYSVIWRSSGKCCFGNISGAERLTRTYSGPTVNWRADVRIEQAKKHVTKLCASCKKRQLNILNWQSKRDLPPERN